MFIVAQLTMIGDVMGLTPVLTELSKQDQEVPSEEWPAVAMSHLLYFEQPDLAVEFCKKHRIVNSVVLEIIYTGVTHDNQASSESNLG